MMRPEPLLSSRVLDLIDAYGGIERWRSVEELILTASVGGSSLYAKHQGKTIRHLQAHISPQRQRVVIIPYPKIGACGIFDEGTVRIESDGDDVLAERLDARSAFRGLRHQLWWDKLDMLYFCSYALWTYLTTPFTLVEPGFEVRELESWEEAHETWRRVSVTFPSDIHTHTREQILYFDKKGLIRRHDYTAEVFGKWAKAAHYLHDYKTFDGLVISTRRRVYFRRRNNRPLTTPTLIWLDIEAVDLLLRGAGSRR